ncbi:hypothetical protein [Leptogranulimonas caecicola]|uniref:hypothetical protein n=1 Tax=Leptogranulimonas caecicola TaxID=2894156 RepID=UPI003898E243
MRERGQRLLGLLPKRRNRLTPARSSGNVAPGIGAERYKNGGTINIYGGTVYAQGGKEGAGIGGSASCSHGGIVKIYGGTVTAVGGRENWTGIGGGGWDQSYNR